MNLRAFIWSDPRFIYPIAVTAVVLLFITIWLFRRPKRSGRQAGIICLMLSILAHIALLILVPLMGKPNGGSPTVNEDTNDSFGIESVTISSFEPEMNVADVAGDDKEALVAPLPMSDMEDLVGEPAFAQLSAPTVKSEITEKADSLQEQLDPTPSESELVVPDSLAQDTPDFAQDILGDLDDVFGEMLKAQTVSVESTAQISKANDEPAQEKQEPLSMPELDTTAAEAIPAPSSPQTKIAPIARAGDINPNSEKKPASTVNSPPQSFRRKSKTTLQIALAKQKTMR